MAPFSHRHCLRPLTLQTKNPPTLNDMGDSIDKSTFEQILEMDDDEERDFSKGIVYGYFDQAEGTFDKMGKAL
jgi:osomolarity two-component system phosphorelay intermediate protein YPD1